MSVRTLVVKELNRRGTAREMSSCPCAAEKADHRSSLRDARAACRSASYRTRRAARLRARAGEKHGKTISAIMADAARMGAGHVEREHRRNS